jgi:hypothetical protein
MTVSITHDDINAAELRRQAGRTSDAGGPPDAGGPQVEIGLARDTRIFGGALREIRLCRGA